MPKNIVWVLGSGFSQPLGGPTLADLFSAAAGNHLATAFGVIQNFRGNGQLQKEDLGRLQNATQKLRARESTYARMLFLYGKKFEHGSFFNYCEPSNNPVGEPLWSDAEGFLDLLESASLNRAGAAARRLRSILETMYPAQMREEDPVSLENLALGARRLLALECSYFLLDVDTESERWEPYRAWRDWMLAAKDTKHSIVSFNYDLVLEKLGFQELVQLPGSAPRTRDGFGGVVKLHGSTNWLREGQKVRLAEHDLDCASCPAADIAIAPPGPAKLGIAGEFGDLWNRAQANLQEADAVVFMGYRFPETDANARTKILSYMRGRRNLLVHVVLGPNLSHPHVARLQALIKWACPKASVHAHPLYAQDFMSVLHGIDLADPNGLWRRST